MTDRRPIPIVNAAESFDIDVAAKLVTDFLRRDIGSLAISYDDRLIALSLDPEQTFMRGYRSILRTEISCDVNYSDTYDATYERARITTWLTNATDFARTMRNIVAQDLGPEMTTVRILPYTLRALPDSLELPASEYRQNL